MNCSEKDKLSIKFSILWYLIPKYTYCPSDSKEPVSLMVDMVERIEKKLNRVFSIEYLERQKGGNWVNSADYLDTVKTKTPMSRVVFTNEYMTFYIEMSNSLILTKQRQNLNLDMTIYKNTTGRNLMTESKYYELYRKVLKKLDSVADELFEYVSLNKTKSFDRLTYFIEIKNILDNHPNIKKYLDIKNEVVADVIIEMVEQYSSQQKKFLKSLKTKSAVMHYNSEKFQLIESEVEKFADGNLFKIEKQIEKTFKNQNSDFCSWRINCFTDQEKPILAFSLQISLRLNGNLVFRGSHGGIVTLSTKEEILKFFEVLRSIEKEGIPKNFPQFYKGNFYKNFIDFYNNPKESEIL